MIISLKRLRCAYVLYDDSGLMIVLTELTWRASLLLLEDAVEVAEIVESAIKTYLADALGGIYQHAGSITQTQVDDILRDVSAGMELEETAERTASSYLPARQAPADGVHPYSSWRCNSSPSECGGYRPPPLPWHNCWKPGYGHFRSVTVHREWSGTAARHRNHLSLNLKYRAIRIPS